MLCGYPPFSADCGMDCGWKQGGGCEYCAVRRFNTAQSHCLQSLAKENLLENIQDGHFEFPKKDWARVSGAGKDLIMRMLVRESQVCYQCVDD